MSHVCQECDAEFTRRRRCECTTTRCIWPQAVRMPDVRQEVWPEGHIATNTSSTCTSARRTLSVRTARLRRRRNKCSTRTSTPCTTNCGRLDAFTATRRSRRRATSIAHFDAHRRASFSLRRVRAVVHRASGNLRTHEKTKRALGGRCCGERRRDEQQRRRRRREQRANFVDVDDAHAPLPPVLKVVHGGSSSAPATSTACTT